MLKEIQCNGFKSHGKIREPIVFHMGLNTILGGYSADNSIGKSTLLAIIDFCFGGDTFLKDKISDHIGTVYPINFTFEFNKTPFRFSRQEDEPDKVWKCSDNYVRIEETTIDDFRAFLKEKYEIPVIEASFREYVGICTRFNGRYNVIPEKPITTYQHESDRNAIDNLEKIFDKYNLISELRTKKEKANEKKRAYSDARRFEFLPSQITKTQHDANLIQINKLKRSLSEVAQRVDKTISKEELKNAVEAEELKGRLRILKRRRAELLTSKKTIQMNIEEGDLPVPEDLKQLGSFFPGIELKNLEAVISFHKTLGTVLASEMEEESQRINTMLKTISDEISAVENSIRNLNAPVNIDIKAFEDYSEIKEQISKLQSVNKSFEQYEKLRSDSKTASENLEQTESALLKEIETQINGKLNKTNKLIYGDDRATHNLSLTTGSKYSYINPNDKGTGTSFKSLIIFDLCLLSLCKVPYLIHDSLLFKNIGDQPVERIMNLYGTIKDKQLFISFDKINSYDGDTPKILKDSSVIYLSENGNELYGQSWAKKPNNEADAATH